MSKDSKRLKSAKYMNQYDEIFACPLCHSRMKVVDNGQLVCENNHAFDLAKQGYINLLTSNVQSKYDKELFEARRNLITETDFFQPLTEKIGNIITDYFENTDQPLRILDTGTGEGSHLVRISEIIQSTLKNDILGVGIDLSKEGIQVAAKHYPNIIWAVADLANTPFRNQSFDVILNILSPSNYIEFNRLLKKEGLIVKVVPQSQYLKELRVLLFEDSKKQHYSNDDTVSLFTQHFPSFTRERIIYTVDLNGTSIQWLLKMTPLTWSAAKEKLDQLLNKDSATVTVDYDILIGKNSHITKSTSLL